MVTGTLHDALDRVAAHGRDTRVDFPSEPASITLGELADSTRVMARSLAAAGIGPGSRVGIFSQNAPEFLQALFAITRTGAAACPLPLPTAAWDLAGHAHRLARIVSVAGIRDVVVSSRFRGLASRFDGAVGNVAFVCAGDLLAAAPASGRLPLVDAAEMAIVQFTSGSTAAPKGVRLTHANTLAGIEAISEGIALGRDGDGGGSWLPLFHDMGLFATLSAILRNVPMTVWSPASFVKDPARWLRQFLASGATISPAPNFGYDQLVAAMPPLEVAGLDMRHWRVAFNGAEPVALASVERFLEHFAPAGFAPEAMFPVYGMAEATLAVTFPPLGRPPVSVWVDRDLLANAGRVWQVPPGHPHARAVVAVGRPVRGVDLRLSGPDAGRLPVDDQQVGEIEICGDPVTSGYLLAEGTDDDTFTADGWLRTGDLGFRLDGDVFVTGRTKEMIIVHGANFYPEDVEGIARDIPGVFKRRCVAVAGRTHDSDRDGGRDGRGKGADGSDGDGAEVITLLAETSLDDPAARDRLAGDLRAQITGTLGLSDLAVHLVPPSTLPRTSSGKFQRLAIREQSWKSPL
ncbi:AMP-binding protein [Protofrankia coriariae]|uniref:AMP-dependent synthetase n=1 Tax=Protofrankia coriariae TaxID=1562887 RepID=A0ABR5F619_9ACTN|nr:AMP-binding protein [Protofrankia coriariae]KLL12139.1 AMP-dependent synthetase [Protofrankia coriariae]